MPTQMFFELQKTIGTFDVVAVNPVPQYQAPEQL
jgi:hypothetical protein